jgi:hypothetical protein
MANSAWCGVCNQAIDTTVTRGIAAAALPLAGVIAGALPGLFLKRAGMVRLLVQGAVGAGAAYLANRYLVPKLQSAVCGRCGAVAGRAAA